VLNFVPIAALGPICIIKLDDAYYLVYLYAQRCHRMRTTLDLPEDLIAEAMRVTKIATKTALIKTALANLITKERVKDLKKYYGRIDLDINLDVLRKR
jgi:Arc/MetJ family transcription regulator